MLMRTATVVQVLQDFEAPPTIAPLTPTTVANPHIDRSLGSKETRIQSHNRHVRRRRWTFFATVAGDRLTCTYITDIKRFLPRDATASSRISAGYCEFGSWLVSRVCRVSVSVRSQPAAV